MAITIGNDAKGSTVQVHSPSSTRAGFIPQPNWGLDRDTPMALLLLRGVIEQAGQTTTAAVKADPTLVIEAYFNSCLCSSIRQVIGSEDTDDDTFYFQELCGYWHTIVFMLEYKTPEKNRSYWKLSRDGVAIHQTISPKTMIAEWRKQANRLTNRRDQENAHRSIRVFEELLKR